MARYVIGDVQGCFTQLQQLLQLIDFQPEQDQLWFCGDLIARGPQSLETLRFVRSLGASAITVLGNHDLNFLASRYGYGRICTDDQLQTLQQAPDVDLLCEWLIQQPLLHYAKAEHILLVHAGLSPQWDLATAMSMADEIQQQLKNKPAALFAQMYGNGPDSWSLAKNNYDRWRYSINSLTRMRYCFQDGRLELKQKGELSDNPALSPWYEFWREREHPQIFFGHWAALAGHSPVEGIHALDTGCVWGQSLTCYCIESKQRFSVAGYKKSL